MATKGTSDYPQTGDSTRDMRGELHAKASDIGSGIKDEAMRQAGRTQEQTAESLHAFADAVRSAGDQLAQKDQGPVARILGEAAAGLENLSTALSRKSLEEMVGDARDFGRRNPGAFMAGSLLVGIALGRLARSSYSTTEGVGQDSHSGNHPRHTSTAAAAKLSAAGGQPYTKENEQGGKNER